MARPIAFAIIACLAAGRAEAAPPLPVVITKEFVSLTAPDAGIARRQAAAIPGYVSVTGSEAWENSRAATLKDMLDYAPGVYAQPRNGAESMRLSIRGSGITRTFQGRGLLVMQDGIPLNTADGSFDFQAIDPWLVDYVEVFRGANALRYGASTLGGAVNLHTPAAHAGDTLTLRGEGGSFGTAHGLMSYGNRAGAWDQHTAVTGFRQDGFRRQNEQRTGRISSNVGWRIQPELETRFYLSYTDTSAEIPGSLTRTQLRQDPKQANPLNVAGRFARNLHIARLGNRTAWQQDAHRLDTTWFFGYRELDNPVTTYIRSEDRDWGARLNYTYDGGRSQWQAGLNAQYGTIDEARHDNNGGQAGSPVVTREERALAAEPYLQYDYALRPGLHVIASTQGAYAYRDITETYPAARAQRTDYFGVNPRLGMRYEYAPSGRVYANISRSFEPPTLSELSAGNEPGFGRLAAQYATTAEIGQQGAWRNLAWEAAYYHSWVENEFITYRFPDGSTSTVNADQTTRDGVELAAGYTPADRHLLKAAYTWNYFTLRGDRQFGSNRLPGIPEHYLRGQWRYSHPSGLSAGPNVEWVPRAYPVDLANTLYAGPYALLGFGASYAATGGGVRVYMEGRNLLDKTYAATTGVIPNAFGQDQRQFFPGEGRAVYAGVALQW